MPKYKYFLNTFATGVFTYTFLFCFSSLLPEKMQKYGLFNNQANLVYLVQNKAKTVADSMQETNLGLNFIGNYHKLSPLESQIFQSSGLVHLLAISGAQILPVVNLICYCLSIILYTSLKNKLNPHRIMQISSKINIYISFMISLFISILFGGTGALLRVSWLNFFKRIKIIHFIQIFIFRQTSEFIEPLVEKFFILLLVSLFFGNIFSNYSFILSAIGASCAEISAYISKFILNKNGTIICLKFFSEIFVTILTCVFVGIVLSPLTFNSITNSCLANIFAIPIITFLVTPLALLILIIPSGNIVFEIILNGLDYSLMLFKHIAFVFSDSDNFITNNTRLFSADGLLYLNIIMIILWTIIDLIRGRKIYMMRKKIINYE